MIRAQSKLLRPRTSGIFAALLLAACLGFQSQAVAEEAAKPAVAEKTGIELSKDREQLKLPGIKIRIKERYVDVDATVSLDAGMLELLACTKDTKEHESIIAVDAKAAHIHASLLLLNAIPGNPAMRKEVEEGRWIDLPPRGSEVDVFLVVENEKGEQVERPISDFIEKGRDDYYETTGAEDPDPKEKIRFPTNTFLFAGSHVYKGGEGPPVYLSDESGNVISLATFGDELLCLPGVHGQDNQGLVWAVDSTHLPPVGSKVILRLRPKKPGADDEEKD